MQTQPRPIPSPYCPVCADKRSLPAVCQGNTFDAFSLSSLLPTGTITVAIHDGEQSCPGASNNRDWRALPLRNLSTHPADTLFRQLAFLTEHLFLRATCRLGASGHILFIRLYLIPHDLPNVAGRLHCRPEIVVKEARRHMCHIVPLLERNAGLWDADEACLNAPPEYFLPSHTDNRTMAEIYSDLPSPTLDPPTNENTTLSQYVASGGEIWGLRTALYGYQRHSVAVMLQKESATSPIPDPLYISVLCMSGVYCYIQPSTMSVVRDCPAFFPSRAGILCEELGTGKTVMAIALILTTTNKLPDPEESLVDERPVMTPLAYRHFPSAEYALARERAGFNQESVQRVPSLVELLIHHLSVSNFPEGRPMFTDDLEASHMWPLIRANRPFYHHYNTELAVEALKKSRRRNAPCLSPRTMYLSSSTLVIVPLNLLGQWKSEIDQHCHECVRYLVVRPSMDLPDAKKLASDYDLIIMSDTRFRQESKKSKVEKLHDLKSCACSYLIGSRVPDCRCSGDHEVTPLLQIRWKRLVMDEGHIAGNMAATINHFVRQLSIQHKWIVTGTPTSNILGLELGRTTDERGSSHNDDLDDLTLSYPDSDSSMPTSSSQDDGCQRRIWSSYESINLRKLGTMIGDFLAVPQFRIDPKSFVRHVSTPLCDQYGPRAGAVDVLKQVMQMVMVRHRVEDVENDVLLPPMTHDMICMDLDNYALKSYNAMQAALAINAIDSERTGRDYLFEPRNAKDLQTTINNASQGLFWSASDILYNVDQNCELADEYMHRAVKRNVSPEDMDLLQQALKHSNIAAKDEMWRAAQRHPDVPFKVSGLDPDILEAWTRSGLCSSHRTFDIMHPDRLIHLRTLLRQKPFIKKECLVEEGIVTEMEETEPRKSANSQREVNHAVEQTKEMAKEVRLMIEGLKSHAEQMNDEKPEDREERARLNSAASGSLETTATSVLKSSFLSGVKVGPSLSTKLNYILSEVRKYSAKDKFLIFSNSLLTLFQIGDALSLFEIKYLRYTNQEKYLLREQCIMTFETSDVHRVLLIELKLGARGLNLISASRIIFCEPVWHPDVESQAIKRAHRIGQSRPVTVKTLVIRSTAEEAMIARRQYLRSSDKIPSMTTESGMREYLMHPRFLSDSLPNDTIDANGVVVDLPFGDADNQAASLNMQGLSVGGSDACRVDIGSTPTYSSEVGNSTLPHKRVRFE